MERVCRIYFTKSTNNALTIYVGHENTREKIVTYTWDLRSKLWLTLALSLLFRERDQCQTTIKQGTQGSKVISVVDFKLLIYVCALHFTSIVARPMCGLGFYEVVSWTHII